ncbi:DUF6415 family natural product biosynthesis protein [Streptomyces sp. NPDC055013]
MNGTADRTTESQPADIETMRRTAQEVISAGALIEDSDELETMILLLRGMVMVLVPDVEAATGHYAKNHTPAICARAGVQEARTRIYADPGTTVPQLVGHAQRLARCVLALIRHYGALECDVIKPIQVAFLALGDHVASCKTCSAVDGNGVNLNLPCDTADELDRAYKAARRRRASTV